MQKKLEEMEQARALRQQGLSIKEICKLVPAAKSSISVWVRDVELTEAQKKVLKDRNKNKGYKDAIIDLLNLNYTYAEIEKQLGCSRTTIKHYAKIIGYRRDYNSNRRNSRLSRADILQKRVDIERWIAEGKSKGFICRELVCTKETLERHLKNMGIVYLGDRGCIAKASPQFEKKDKNKKSSNSRYKFTDEQIAEAVKNNITVNGVLRNLGASTTSGAAHKHISKRIQGLGLDISHFNPYSVDLRKNHTSNKTKISAEKMLVRLPVGSSREKSYRLRRAMLEVGILYECHKCHLTSWQGEKLNLEIEHKDGDPLNNERDNLIFLCPNCHSQTETYCRRKV